MILVHKHIASGKGKNPILHITKEIDKLALAVFLKLYAKNIIIKNIKKSERQLTSTALPPKWKLVKILHGSFIPTEFKKKTCKLLNKNDKYLVMIINNLTFCTTLMLSKTHTYRKRCIKFGWRNLNRHCKKKTVITIHLWSWNYHI